jgi:Txe/YoeB family toxin of Txe-Axe toxin-antitoxin module
MVWGSLNPLGHLYAGNRSRRITGELRLIYMVKGDESRIASLRDSYRR